MGTAPQGPQSRTGAHTTTHLSRISARHLAINEPRPTRLGLVAFPCRQTARRFSTPRKSPDLNGAWPATPADIMELRVTETVTLGRITGATAHGSEPVRQPVKFPGDRVEIPRTPLSGSRGEQPT